MTDKPLILVADDETRIRRLVVESLENAGFDVCQAQDGRQAVDVFRLSPVEPDLVILDLMMPEMDGEEALKVATTVKLTRALWIIPLSLVSALIFRQKGKKIQIPWFIFWFGVAMLVNTYCNLPTQLTHGISVAARCGLSATLFLIGGGLSIEVIRKVGLKPLVLGIILWAVISVASLAVILLL